MTGALPGGNEQLHCIVKDSHTVAYADVLPPQSFPNVTPSRPSVWCVADPLSLGAPKNLVSRRESKELD